MFRSFLVLIMRDFGTILSYAPVKTQFSSVLRYTFAFIIFAVAFSLRLALLPVDGGLAFVTFYPAMVVTALLCGVGPTILVILLGGLIGYHAFIAPFQETRLHDTGMASLSAYAFSGIILIILVINTSILKRSRLLLASIVNSSNDAIACKGLDGIIISWNPGAERLFGYTAQEVIGKPMTIIFPPDRLNEEADLLHRISIGEVITRYETVRVRKDGSMVDISVNLSPVRDGFGRIIGATKIAHDITDQKNYQGALLKTAHYDELTGLPNRILFHDYLSKSLSRAGRAGQEISLFFLDLDGFKAVNDLHGHQAGDLLLRSVAQRLLSCVRSGDLVSRLGGDEFTIIIEDCQPSQLATLAEKIIHALKEPFPLEGITVRISASIGISINCMCGNDSARLIHMADVAMYQAKDSGKRCFRFFCIPDGTADHRMRIGRQM